MAPRWPASRSRAASLLRAMERWADASRTSCTLGTWAHQTRRQSAALGLRRALTSRPLCRHGGLSQTPARRPTIPRAGFCLPVPSGVRLDEPFARALCKGLSPHQFTPMSGAYRMVQQPGASRFA